MKRFGRLLGQLAAPALVPVWVLLGAVAAFGAWSVVGSTTADAQDAHAPDGHKHDDSDAMHLKDFTRPGDKGDWPPRPVRAGKLLVAHAIAKGIIGSPDDVNEIDLAAIDAAAIVDVTPGALIDFALRLALGSEFSLISHAEPQQGKYDSIGERWTWFSRSANHTIIAELGNDGRLSVEILKAEEMQPILSRPERDWAAEIGKEWLLTNGFPEVEGLQGTAIRALDDGKFYDVRMAYVTFATDNFADPTHSVLVDLTNLVAVSGRSL